MATVAFMVDLGLQLRTLFSVTVLPDEKKSFVISIFNLRQDGDLSRAVFCAHFLDGCGSLLGSSNRGPSYVSYISNGTVS
jgi:hypothetical protein